MSCGAALERSQELAERQFDLVIEAFGVNLAGRQRYGPRHHALALDPDRLAPLGRGFAPSRKEPSHHPAQQNSKKRHGDGQRQNGAARYLAALRSCRLVGPDDRRSGWRVVCAVGVDAARVLDGRRRFLRRICRRRTRVPRSSSGAEDRATPRCHRPLVREDRAKALDRWRAGTLAARYSEQLDSDSAGWLAPACRWKPRAPSGAADADVRWSQPDRPRVSARPRVSPLPRPAAWRPRPLIQTLPSRPSFAPVRLRYANTSIWFV